MMILEPLHKFVSFRTGKLNSNAAVKDGKYPFFTCSQETYRTNTFSFDTTCVLLGGNNANGIYPLKYFSGKFDAYQRTYVIESLDRNKLETRYLYFALKPQLERLRSISTGAATKFLTLTILQDVKIELPDIKTQRRIASILSAYDDLIENNTRRIAILEEMARRIYEEWFVQFRFPGHEHGRMVDSELGKIPEGWANVTIREVTSHISRGISPKYSIASTSIVLNQKCIRDNKINLELGRRHIAKVPSNKFIVFGDVLINSTGVGTLGRIAQVYQDISNYTVDSHVSIVRPDNMVNIDYFGLFLTSLQAHFDSLGTGSTGQTELGREAIAKTNFLLPPENLQDQFGHVVSPMRRNIIALQSKNTNLRATRDFLLPKLISGEIDVAEFPEPQDAYANNT